MPLLRKHPYKPRPNPVLSDPKTAVYQHPLTSEIFTTYEEYVQGHQQLTRPQWTCKLTGRTGLTYEQALASEQEAGEEVQAMPVELRKYAATRAQYSLAALSTVVDGIVEELKSKYLIGEFVLLDDDAGRKQNAKIITLLPNDVFVVEILDSSLSTVIGKGRSVNGELLSRPKNALSKILLKKYLRAITFRRNAFLPWQLTEECVAELGINTEPPADIAALLMKDAHSRLKSPKKSKPIQLESPPQVPMYPMDDFILLPEDVIEEATFPPDLEVCPSYFPGALEVWTFLVTFGKHVGVSPLGSWEDFMEALQWCERKNPPLEAFYYALLYPIAKYRKSSSKTAYFEWLQAVSTFFPLSYDYDEVNINGESKEEEEVIVDDNDDNTSTSSNTKSKNSTIKSNKNCELLIGETDLAEYLARFKWSEEKDPFWSTLLAGFLADCAFISPGNVFLNRLVSTFVNKKDPTTPLASLAASQKVHVMLALIRITLLHFPQNIKAFVDENNIEELLMMQKELIVEKRRLEDLINEQEQSILAYKESEEMKQARKAEAVLRGYRANESKIQKKQDKTERELEKIKRIRSEPLGLDHACRKYWDFSNFGLPAPIYITEISEQGRQVWLALKYERQFEMLTNEYLNEKGIRERALKQRLLANDFEFEQKEVIILIPEMKENETSEVEETSEVGKRKRRAQGLAELSSKRYTVERKTPAFLKYKNSFE